MQCLLIEVRVCHSKKTYHLVDGIVDPIYQRKQARY